MRDRYFDTNTPKVAAVVCFYMSAALVMVFVNKVVLNGSPDLPLLFLLLQLLIAVLLLHVSAVFISRVEIPKLELETAKKLTPVILVNIIGLVFNTLCLRDVEASFFQIARGLVLPLTIIVSSVHTRSKPSTRVVIAAVIVAVGFLVGVAPSTMVPANVAPSGLSLFYGVLSSLFIAFHAVLIKSSLPYCNNSTIQLAYWTNLGSAVFLFPFVLLHKEPSILEDLIHDSNWDGQVFLWGSIVTGLFGFLLCVAGLLSIKVTSPITHMFSSAARSVIQTLLGVWLFKDLMTVNRAGSILVIMIGTIFYTWVKSSETALPPPRKDVDLEAVGNRKPDEHSEDDEVTVVFEEGREKA
ncbi:GDP-fucose transporter [Rhizopogon vesiculosus]|uniref:GDP-fucose transporter n=1 Tax=Rhizopogon vesiculosus TaxID=180088 RepID=A0A1J8R1P4_9AGAM|nr:GDP-fucose transporter [Rhizopogon vesiculosus]